MNKDVKNTALALLLGITAAAFLSTTFSINSLLANTGGHWAWTACLRSLFMIPVMAVPLLLSKGGKSLVDALKAYPILFVKWGTIGFGGLYTCMALASLFMPGWLVAAIFQVNILAGVLMAPLIYPDHRRKIPVRTLVMSLVIVLGVMVMQLDRWEQMDSGMEMVFSTILVLIGAVLWPLANRKLLVELEKRNLPLNATQRVLGLTVGCLPLLLALAVYAYMEVGVAPITQISASFYSAIFSGYIGGVAFYQATQQVKHNPVALATVEATQVFEIFFALLAEIWLIQAPLPGYYGFLGMGIIFLGILVQFFLALNHSSRMSAQTRHC